MKFEDTRVSLEPRSAANCLDLALRFCGQHLWPIFCLWALFLLPLGTVTYLAARYTNWGYLVAFVCGFFGSAPYGVMLIGGVARSAFGEEFSFAKMLADLRTDAYMLAKILGLRVPIGLAFLICVIPGALLSILWGFLVESRVLTTLHQKRHDRRTKDLIKSEFIDLMVRGGAIMAFGCLFWFLAEITVDFLWTVLFSQSLLFGRFGDLGSVMEYELGFDQYVWYLWLLITADPAVLVLHLGTGLLAFTVCRIAWFFCYLDLRIRYDCWDLELEILSEADRLRTTGS